jgi:hypothetical protein
MAQIKVKFRRERETKGAVLFKEVDENGKMIESMYDGKIGSVYIRKTALAEVIPNEVSITVEF